MDAFLALSNTLIMQLLLAFVVSLICGGGAFVQKRRCLQGPHHAWLKPLLQDVFLSLIAGYVGLLIGLWQEWHPALTNLVVVLFSFNAQEILPLLSKRLINRLKEENK